MKPAYTLDAEVTSAFLIFLRQQVGGGWRVLEHRDEPYRIGDMVYHSLEAAKRAARQVDYIMHPDGEMAFIRKGGGRIPPDLEVRTLYANVYPKLHMSAEAAESAA